MPTILIRQISAYLAADVLLGVFPTVQDAEQCRNAYFAMRTQTPASDPWRKQPYKPDGLQMSDLIIKHIQGSAISSGTVVFVVSKYSEALGQTLRELISVHNDKAVASRQVARLEAANTDSFLHYYRVQEAIVGQLLPDDPDLQPSYE